MNHTFPATLVAGRRAVLDAGTTLDGAVFTRALSDATDRGLRELVAAVCGGETAGLAVVATGGYGRRELAPASDLDVLLLHDGSRGDIDTLASALWYPLWDAGLRVGHAVRTIDEQVRLARDDLQTATACLSVRHLAGTVTLSERLAELALAGWRRRPQRSLDALAAQDAERRERAGDVAYLLEPDLKDGVGGLRDVHSLRWASAAGLELSALDAAAIGRASARLLAVRVALQLSSGRPGDVLRLESQDAVAERVGASADVLMAEIAAAGRTIAWVYDRTWSEDRGRRRRQRRDERITEDVVVRAGAIELEPTADPTQRPLVVFEVAVAAATRSLPVGRDSLDRLAAELPDLSERFPEGWPHGALDRFVALLLTGHEAIPVLESLDQVGLLTRILPEWAAVRSKPQRNAYHRFTVDRHLWEATANAALLVDRVDRPDLLVLAALFHDLGKGFPGDHTDQGVRLIGLVGPRLGLVPSDVDVLANLIRNHLLLPDVGVRRDLADPATTANVAAAVRSTAELDLLHALTIADSLATGPTAWSEWKAGLVNELVERTRVELGGGGSFDPEFRLFPDGEAQAAMAAGRQEVRIEGDSVTTVTADVPGSFARVAGALSLHRLDVVSAMADSQLTASGGAMAAARFRFLAPRERPVVAFADELRATIERALAGELAIEARLAERARSASRRRRLQAAGPGEPTVTFLDDASDVATVIEVRAPTVPGLLHRLAKAIADVGLDIRHATVQTVGPEAVDTFYVLNQRGDVVSDDFHRNEIRRALLHAASS